MDSSNDLNLEEQVKKRAYELYERRKKLAIWQYGKLGTEKGDYYEALSEIRKDKKCGLNQPHN